MFKVYDNGKPAVFPQINPNITWGKFEYETFDEAVEYARLWIQGTRTLNLPDSWNGDSFEYRKNCFAMHSVDQEDIEHSHIIEIKNEGEKNMNDKKNSNSFLINDVLPNPFEIEQGDVYRGIGDLDSEIRLVVTNIEDDEIYWIITDDYEEFCSTPNEFRMRIVCSKLTPFGKVKMKK